MNTTGKIAQESPSELISRMDQEFFPEPWTFEQWNQMNPNHHKLYTWKEDEELLGFALFGVLPDDDLAHLYKILIHPSKRRQGCAMSFWTSLVMSLKQEGLRTIYLEVASSNQQAISFYKKNGFKLVRLIKSYYSNGEDALVMMLTL